MIKSRFVPIILVAVCKKLGTYSLIANDNFDSSISDFDRQVISAIGLAPNSSFSQSNSYLFKGADNHIELTVKEKGTGKLVLEKLLKKEDGTANINFLYMENRIVPMPEKAALVDGKITLIYMFRPTVSKYTEPVDFAVARFYGEDRYDPTPFIFSNSGRQL